MSKKEKLVAKLLTNPKDFTYDEACTLLHYFGYYESNKGKTSGSRVIFKSENGRIYLHKPHPGSILKEYQVEDIVKELKSKNLI